jgi:predicted DsbA family dithiol-disulfide isomerase
MLSIQIVSDVVCPWCWIGSRRLQAAIALVEEEYPAFSYRKSWLPFFLNPDTPAAGEPYRPFLEKKFGGRERVEQIFAQIRTTGQSCGLDYAFEKIEVRANTLLAHRLIHWVQQQGDAEVQVERLVERLFQAQFQFGENVGDAAVLVAAAAECGYDASAVRDYLASNTDAELIVRTEAEIRQLGITMVPTFILAGQHAVVGAEEPTTLAAAIKQILKAETP